MQGVAAKNVASPRSSRWWPAASCPRSAAHRWCWTRASVALRSWTSLRPRRRATTDSSGVRQESDRRKRFAARTRGAHWHRRWQCHSASVIQVSLYLAPATERTSQLASDPWVAGERLTFSAGWPNEALQLTAAWLLRRYCGSAAGLRSDLQIGEWQSVQGDARSTGASGDWREDWFASSRSAANVRCS